MLKEAICTADTIEEATKAAIEKLDAPYDADIIVEVMQEPVKKTLGLFGGSPAKVKVYYEQSDFVKAIDYINSILNGLGIKDPQIDTNIEGNDVKFEIKCSNDYGAVIGRRGETLDAIQYLTRLVVNRGTEDYKRISINVGDYRQKRERTLRDLATRTAGKVKKYGRNQSLDPMNPYERRIIHTTIQEIGGVESHSVGTESSRRVVITLVGGQKNGGGYKDQRPDRYNKTSNNPSKRPDYRSSQATEKSHKPHTPRSDAASASLYEKIDIKNDK